jgi:pimeloyl-ACP methyl ester carboxylesterase
MVMGDMQQDQKPKHDRTYFMNLLRFAIRVVAILTFLLYFGLPILDAYNAMHPPRHPIGDITPADLGLAYYDVTLVTSDDLELYGWYIPSENGAAVVLVHAYNGNRTGMIYHAELLARHGYGALLYDTRTQGESEGELYALGWEDYLDIEAAVDYLLGRSEIDPERIAVLGLSAGAKASLYTATQNETISAVVVEGTRWRTFDDMLLATEPGWYIWLPTEWISWQFVEWVSGIHNPTSLREAVPQITSTPLLLITADAELATSQAYYGLTQGPATIWIRDEAGHQIDALFDEPEEYEQRLIGFLNQALLIQSE